MRTLLEIEKAADNLPAKDKQELFLFLAARLRSEGNTLPAPRQFSAEEVSSWIAEDEADWKKFQSKQ
jgi:hypothetical protein